MTDRSRKLSYENAGYISGKMVNDLSPRKTMIILVIVVGCFAILWPKVFYPMLVGSANNRIKPSSIDRTQGCCDVIYEKDITTIKVMSEICRQIIKDPEEHPLSNKELIQKCQNIVLDTCGIDISAVLQEQVRLGRTTMQILEEIRSLNGSLCLKYNFGVATWKLGVPHRVTVKMSPSYSIRQERPLHLRSEMVHPAFRERGRAIPQAEFAPTKPAPPSHLMKKVVEGRPGPIPGMRPTIGGAGHVVPPSKQGGNSMGLIMPLYTIGIVVFFAYTVMKIVFKKQSDVLYHPINPDPHFRREVFEADRGHVGSKASKDVTSGKLGWKERDARDTELDQLRHRLMETEMAMERIVEQMGKVPLKFQDDVLANGSANKDDQSSVQVLGMQTTASRENGQKWSSSSSPLLPSSQPHPPDTPPQEIFLEGSLPPQSHLLVTDSATEAQKLEAEEDPAVVLAGKMTLSVISLDSSENGTEESSNSGKKPEERSSSNVSEEFEKIDVAQLEEEMNDIIAEAEHEKFDNSKEFIRSETEACLMQTAENILEHTEENIIIEDNIKEKTASIENLIEESVGAVVETIQDKQKELDSLLLQSEEDLAKTTEFFDSKIEQIHKNLAHIENVQEINASIEEVGNVKEELLSAADEFANEEEEVKREDPQAALNTVPPKNDVRNEVTKESIENMKEELLSAAEEFVNIQMDDNAKNIEKEQIETLDNVSKIDLPIIEDSVKTEFSSEIKGLGSKQIEATVAEIEEKQTEETPKVESNEENVCIKDDVEELIIPKAQEESSKAQEMITTETNNQEKTIVEDVKIEERKELDTSSVIERDNNDLESPSQDLLQEDGSSAKERDEKTDNREITDSEIHEEEIKFDDEYLLESDNEQEEDEIDREENVQSELAEAGLLDDKNSTNNDEDVDEEEYEEDSEGEYEEEIEIDEEIEQEVVDYVSDEEGEIEVEEEEEEEEDLDEIEDVISHV